MASDADKIKVWDGFVRLFHWSLVICVKQPSWARLAPCLMP